MDHLFELADQHRGKAHEHDDLADRRQSERIEPDADNQDRQDRQRGRRPRHHGGERPPGQHRHLGAQQLGAHLPHRRHLDLDAGKALDQRDVAERVGRALRHVGIVALDGALQLLALIEDERDQPREQPGEQNQQEAKTPVEKQRQRHQHQQ